VPFSIKLGLSVTVGLVALAGWFYMGILDEAGPQRAVGFLGPFMIFSLWVFPEVMRKEARRTGDGAPRR